MLSPAYAGSFDSAWFPPAYAGGYGSHAGYAGENADFTQRPLIGVVVG